MSPIPPKKMLILNILEILKKHSDAGHRLSQRDIQAILECEYQTVVDRKAIKRNLLNLIDQGYDIEYTVTTRNDAGGGESDVYGEWYYNHEFTDAELRLIIDGLLFSKHIPHRQRLDLIDKLEGLSNKYFKAKVKHIKTLPKPQQENPDLFYSIETLNEAIEEKKMVSFNYFEYGSDKKHHLKTDEFGNPKTYTVSPCQMVAADGRYYLIGATNHYPDASHYRIDRITQIRMLDTQITPMRQTEGLENGLNLPKHLAEHLYMFVGSSARVKFRANKYILNDIMDWFDHDLIITEDKTDNEYVIVDVYVNEQAMEYWATQFGESIVILSPLDLRERVKERIEEMLKKYT